MLKTTNVLRKFSLKLISSFSTLLPHEATTIRLKKKYLKGSICYSLIFLTFYTPVFAAPPKYYSFDSDIYDQSEVLAGRNLSRLTQEEKEELNEELMKELLRRKTEQLEKKLLNKIQDSIKKLHEQLEEADKGQFEKAVIKIFLSDKATESLAHVIFKKTGIAAGIGAAFGGLGGAAIGVAAGMVVSVTREYFTHEINKNIAYRRDPQAIIKKMDDLQEKYEDIMDGLKHEPIGELEQHYVKQKPFIDKSLWGEIERSLIEARFNDYYFQLNTPAIGFALGLPLRPKPLLDRDNQDESQRNLLKRFEKYKPFSIYSEEVKKILLGIIRQTAENSITSTSDSPLRVVEHWFGSGSTGKSTAAKELARFFGLPYYEKRITNPDSEIRIENLTGTLRSIQGQANIGWLGEALRAKVEGPDKESYLNGYLILDDFPVNTQNAQNLLLTTTDPDKRKFPNLHQQDDLNISRLNILIISNENFKSLKPENESNPTFDALISRFDSRMFPEFNEAQKRIIAQPYLEKTLVSKHKPPFFYEVTYVDSTRFEVRYDSQALKDIGFLRTNPKPASISTGLLPTVSLRILQRVLESTLNHYLLQLLQKSTEDYESFEKTKDVKKLRAAAFRGHPKAISELVRKKIASQKNDHKKNKATMRMVAAGHEKSGNIDEAKKWWTESLKLGGWDVWPQVSKHLPYKIKSRQDRQLLKYLFLCAKNLGKMHPHTVGIGNHLYQTGLHSTGSLRVECIDYSAKLGNALAIEEIDKANRKLLLSSLPQELDGEVQKEVQTLSTIKTIIVRLASDEPKIRMEGFNQLFLDTDGAAITSLWSTQRWTFFDEASTEQNGNRGALWNRIRRFNTQSEQSSVIQFHLGLVRSLTDHLLNSRSSFHNKVRGNQNIKINLKYFRKHLKKLSTFHKEYFPEAIGTYEEWFKLGGDKTTKADLLTVSYDLDVLSEESCSDNFCGLFG